MERLSGCAYLINISDIFSLNIEQLTVLLCHNHSLSEGGREDGARDEEQRRNGGMKGGRGERGMEDEGGREGGGSRQ